MFVLLGVSVGLVAATNINGRTPLHQASKKTRLVKVEIESIRKMLARAADTGHSN